jgi:hypothetical protein
MDSVIHHVTTLPAMKSLLSVTHHDYLPNEYDAVVLEPDVYFQLNELKVVDGHLDTIKFVIFCFDHDVQHLQEFVDNCNTAYERRMAEQAGYSPLLLSLIRWFSPRLRAYRTRYPPRIWSARSPSS